MKRLFVSTVVGAALAAASLAPALAQWVPPGSYQQSCTNVRVRDGELTARCTNSSGQRVRSSIAVNSCRGGDIANSNGQLTCNGGNGYGRGRGYGNGNGNGYNNGNGYGRGYNNGNGYGRGNGYAPGGSYQQSCNNIRMSGGVLTASCPSGNGNWMTTSIDPRSCRGTDITNRNGRLSCG
jgi:hypothetical protein